MQTLKINFVDFWPEFMEYENAFIPILKKHFQIIITNNNPDVIIHSIFGGMKESHQYNCKKILFLGENYRAKQFNSDYTISFDQHTNTNYRLPLWQYFILLNPHYLDKLENKIKYKKEDFSKFCSFVVSNSGNFMRNSFFQKLCEYRKVHSYGKFLINDQGLQKVSLNKYWRDAKYNFFENNKHQFAICFENNPYPYYETEKLMDAFLAGSIPIYWGSSKIVEDWNKESFINANGKNFNELIDIIRNIDLNKEQFNKIYNEPVFTDIQLQKHKQNLNNFESWLIEKIKN